MSSGGFSMADDIRVAISSDFFSAFSRLPKSQQGKVAKFITNFQKNPRAIGINYEKIEAARDPQMRSVRIDQGYRGIVLQPESGKVYMLLWVDQHDEAYRWARRHQCAINAETGAIQVFELEEIEAVSSALPEESEPKSGVFASLKDRELMQLGVPEALLGLVRGIGSEEELDEASRRLPVEAYEGLFLLLAGSSYEEITNERELAAEAVDTSDFAGALERETSRSRFVVVENEFELAKMLNAPLEKWRVFLHPSQRRLVEGDRNGPVRVLGGAGTGKTVVALHRARWLARNRVTGNAKVLFTTFTRNLATDIESNLSAICNPEEMARIEVLNLDRWVSQFLRKKKYQYDIIYEKAGQEYWESALDLKSLDLNLPEAFYREEWQRVIQPQSIETLEQYKRASRIGRGTRLSRADRVLVWPVFEEYRNLLAQHRKKEVDDAYRDAAALLASESRQLPYLTVIVDEAQDMSTQAFRLIRQLVAPGTNDLFIVGDGHQRIYGRNKVVLSNCGIEIRGRSRKLKINYRTTEEIRRSAVNLLEGLPVDDLDGGLDDNRPYRSLTHGDPPVLKHFESVEEQTGFIIEYLRQAKEQGRPLAGICLVARTRNELDALDAALSQNGLQTLRIKTERADYGSPEAVRMATMHRVKGLEFDEVILGSINQGLVPLAQAVHDKADEVAFRQADLEERALLYVAMTRAKRGCLICSYGVQSPYLK
jgi:superfamily I DNA/RNA helicase